MARNKKASLLKKANDKGIPTFGNPSVADLEHRLTNWSPGQGWVLRRLYQKPLPEWAGAVPYDKVFWVPNSFYAKRLMETRKIVFMGRSDNPPRDCVLWDIPSATEEEE